MIAAKTEEIKMAVGRLKQLSVDERTFFLTIDSGDSISKDPPLS